MTPWPRAALGDVGEWGSGGTPARNHAEYYGGDIPWATVGDLTDSEVRSTAESITPEGLQFSSAKLVEPGALFVAMYGASIGKLGIPTLPMATNQAIAFVRPKKCLDLRYLFHCLRRDRERLKAAGTGGAQPNISQGKLKDWTIPLPPLREQRRIAAILDDAQSLRVKRSEALRWLDDLTRALFIEMFGDPISNPHRWPVIPLTEVGHLYSGATPSKAIKSNWLGDLPWFSPKDLKRVELYDSIDHVNSEVTANSSLRVLPADTVVFVVRGMILAHTFPVSIIRVPATINQDLKAVRPNRIIDPWYLMHCLRAQSRHILNQVSTAAHGTKRLDRDGLTQIPIPLPAHDLQDSFSKRISRITSIRHSYVKHAKDLDSFFQSLEFRAFEGTM